MKYSTVLLALILGIAAFSNKALCDDEGDYKDPDYADDDAGGDDVEDDEGPPAKITSVGGHMTFATGDTITLPCVIQNGESAVIQWRRSPDIPIYFDHTKQTKDPRFNMDGQFTLHIKDIQKSDAGEYTCQILGLDQIIRYTVEINSAPKILRIVPEGEVRILRKGNPLTLMCEAIGDPKPKIYWTHKKKHSMKEEPLEGDSIHYDQVSRKTSGDFTCTAENNKGKATKTISVDVQYEPEIEIHKDVVNSAEGYESELVCLVHAHPLAKVTWTKGGKTVKDSHHISQISEGTKHILRISNTKNSDFGTYMCIATNDIGSSNKTCLLSGLPSKPTFYSTNVADDGKSPVLTWKVSSHSLITSLELLYKKQEEDKMFVVNPTVIPDGENSYIASHTLKNLEPGTYVAQLRAKNTYGWSALSDGKTFSGDIIGDAGAMQSKYLESSNHSGAQNLEMRISIAFVLSLIVAHFLS